MAWGFGTRNEGECDDVSPYATELAVRQRPRMIPLFARFRFSSLTSTVG
jgi:hypothetical protein